MTILYLDDEAIDLYGNSGISLNFAHADLDRLSSGNTKGSFSFEIVIPATKATSKAFFFPELVLDESFDATTEKSARLEVNGAVQLQGFARIKATVINGEIASYKIVLYEGNSSWINNIKDKKITDIDYSNYNHIYDRNTMTSYENIDSIVGDQLVSYPVLNLGTPLAGEGIWSVEDRLPSFRVWKVFTDIFKDAGYTINSNFINSEFFKSLWFTAENLPERTKAEVEAHKFRVGSNGNDYLSVDGNDAYLNKNLAITWDLDDTYQNHLFYNAEDSPVTPLSNSATRYECNFKGNQAFQWDYIINNQALGLNSRKAVDVKLNLLRERGYTYFPVPFESSLNISTITDNTAGLPRVTTIIPHGYSNGDFVRITGNNYTGTFTIANASTFLFDLVEGTYVSDDTGGFALKMSRIANVTYIHSETITVPKAQPISINSFAGTFLTPFFETEIGDKYYVAGELKTSTQNNQNVYFSGSTNSIDNIFSNKVSQSFVEGATLNVSNAMPPFTQKDFITDLRTMFNLYFHTSEIDKQITIEPRDDFYSLTALDWGSKLDLSKPIEISHLGDRLGKTVQFKYANDSNDKYVEFKENSTKENTPLLSYDFNNTNKNAKDSTTFKTVKNFAPTFMGKGISTAPSARVPLIWDTDVDKIPAVRIKKWKSRILYYGGRISLPTGEAWNFEGVNNTYYPRYSSNYTDALPPYQNDNSLDFSNRGNSTNAYWVQHGLYERYYKNSLNTINTSRKYTMWIHLNSVDILNLDFSAPVYIDHNGDGSYYHLQKINGYTPEKIGTFKCEFIKVVNPVPKVILNRGDTGSTTPPFIDDEIDVEVDPPIVLNDMVHTKYLWVSTIANPTGEWVATEAYTRYNTIGTNGLQTFVTNQETNVKI